VYGPNQGIRSFSDSLYLNNEENLFTVTFMAIPAGFAQLQSISFEEIDSLQRIEKENDCFHSN
jgi:hypothetical protein